MKTTTTERYEVCQLCGGRGREVVYPLQLNTTGAVTATCRGCAGVGQRMVERTVTTESEPTP